MEKSDVKWVFNGKIIVIHGPLPGLMTKTCSFRGALAKFYDIHMVPSNGTLPGKLTMENHQFQRVDPLFLWPFSISELLVYQRVNIPKDLPTKAPP